jgi:DNA 3'-phosphatase
MPLHSHAWPVLLCLTACVDPRLPGDERQRGGLAAEDAGAPQCPDPAPVVPTVRRDLCSWRCRTDGAPQPVVFFDADSTLRVSKQGSVTANDPEDVNILPFVAGQIAELDRQGYLVAIVSNQGGIASGHETYADAEGALSFTISQLDRMGARVHYFDFAEASNGDRKPGTGMGTRLDGLLQTYCHGPGIDLHRSMMIGDSAYKKNVDPPSPDGRPADDFSNADRLFAVGLGIPFEEPTDAFGWRAYEVYNIAIQGELIAMLDAMSTEAQHLEETGREPLRAASLRNEVTILRSIDGL